MLLPREAGGSISDVERGRVLGPRVSIVVKSGGRLVHAVLQNASLGRFKDTGKPEGLLPVSI